MTLIFPKVVWTSPLNETAGIRAFKSFLHFIVLFAHANAHAATLTFETHAKPRRACNSYQCTLQYKLKHNASLFREQINARDRVLRST